MARDTPIAEYLRKQPGFRLRLAEPPATDLGMVVVVPCKDEPALEATLSSLGSAAAPGCSAEVIVVANASAADPEAVRERTAANAAQARALNGWLGGSKPRIHAIEELALDSRHAGVGLARKLGMDEAVARLAAIGRGRGVVVCLDADCTVAPTYLTAIHDWFGAHPGMDAATIHFEHDLDTVTDARHRAGIAGYELFLRCHVQGLRLAGHPSALHTVGSSMAARADSYAVHGGMNRRKAGEDFYFLQKLVEHGSVGQIRTTTVFPSARVSDRVPFGTGRAVGDWLCGEEPEFLAYDARVYPQMAEVIGRIDEWWSETVAEPEEGLPIVVARFLVREGLRDSLAEMRANATSRESFRARFYAWFSPFRALKLIHHLTRETYPKRPVTETAAKLAEWIAAKDVRKPVLTSDLEAWLRWFRRLDREG